VKCGAKEVLPLKKEFEGVEGLVLEMGFDKGVKEG
jgi:hypothetical protein